MFAKFLTTLVALLPFTSPVLSVAVSGYLGNACNGEELYNVVPEDGVCIDVSEIVKARSVVVTQFGPNESVLFFSDASCTPDTNQVGGANQEECFLIPPQQEVLSFQVITS